MTAELLPILITAPPFEDLLIDPISANVAWVTESVAVGDCGLRPAIPLLSEFPEDRLVEFVDGLDVIATDGLENLLIVGGDVDGHTYLFGKTSEHFYVLWHDPDEFEQVGESLGEFLQWMIRERSDYLEGCPWELYFSNVDSVDPIWETLWHKKKVTPEPIYNRAKEKFPWTHDYITSDGFELFNQQLGFGFRFKAGGHVSQITAVADPRSGSKNEVLEFWDWIKRRGFGTDY